MPDTVRDVNGGCENCRRNENIAKTSRTVELSYRKRDEGLRDGL